MDTIDRLIEQFRQFPGIGPRQAKRFVYFLLAQPESYRGSLARLTLELGKQVSVCSSCQRFFPAGKKSPASAADLSGAECPICDNPARSDESLMIVSRDVDFENIEKSHTYDGKYFVLGGLVPILEKDPASRIRIKELMALVEKRSEGGITKGADAKDGVEKSATRSSIEAPEKSAANSANDAHGAAKLKEIIFALNFTPEGENTQEYVTQVLAPLAERNGVKISTLGRGLSTGLELEYSDSETIKNALRNRT